MIQTIMNDAETMESEISRTAMKYSCEGPGFETNLAELQKEEAANVMVH